MRKPGFTLAWASLGVLAASTLVAAMLAPPAAGATSAGACLPSGKCFAVTVSPTSPAAGSSAAFAFAITNEAPTQQLGSVQISAPNGFVITGASGSGTFTSSSALFLNLSLAPSATITLTVSAVAPCGSGAYQWGIAGKQSNNFNGPPGNDFLLDPASAGNLSGTLAGSCSLAFTSDGQPADTAVNAVITSAVGSQGGPVKVEVLDGSGQLATGSTAAVTVAIGSNPGSGSLSGTLTVSARGGVASFFDLSIDRAGVGYTLTATSPGITPMASGSFDILGSLQSSCSTPCTVSSSTTTTSATITTTSPIPAGDFLAVGVGGVDYACVGTYQRVSDPVSFNVLSPAGVALSSAQFTVTLEIDKSAVLASGRTGAAQWQICYASTQGFAAQPGTSGTAVIGGVTFNTGLLLDCSNTQGVPCVQARHKDNAGDVIVTFLASGDPLGWG